MAVLGAGRVVTGAVTLAGVTEVEGPEGKAEFVEPEFAGATRA